MPRETITITTPQDKHALVLHSYITGREQRALTNIFLQNMADFSVNPHEQDFNVKKVNPMLVDEADNLAWKTVVVSIDGHKDGDVITEGTEQKTFSVVDAILDMKLADYTFVVDKVKDITQAKDFLADTTSSPMTIKSS